MRNIFLTLAFGVLFATMPTVSTAQNLDPRYFNRWLDGSFLRDGGKDRLEIIHSSRVTINGTEYVYQFKVINRGTYPILVRWEPLDNLLNRVICSPSIQTPSFPSFIPLTPGETKEFSFTTHLEPIFSEDHQLYILRWENMVSIETENNRTLALEKSGSATYPKQGEILNVIEEMKTSSVTPNTLSTCRGKR